jgi:hypothetical protein
MKKAVIWALIFTMLAGMLTTGAGAAEDLTHAMIFVDQGEKTLYEVIVRDGDLCFSGEDLAKLSGYDYTNDGSEAQFTRGSKAVRVVMNGPTLYFDGHGKPLKTELSNTVIYSKSQDKYYFSGSELLPWLNVTCGEKDGVLFVAADAVSYWDIIGDFNSSDFSFNYAETCKELGIGGKWAKASAYILENGLNMLWDLVYIAPGYTIGSERDYLDIFDDMMMDESSSVYAVQKTLETTSKFKSLLELTEKHSGTEGLPDSLQLFRAYSKTADAFAKIGEYACYFQSFCNDNTLKINQLETLSSSSESDNYPEQIWHAAATTKTNYTDRWAGFVNRLMFDVGDKSLEILVAAATGGTVLEKLLSLLEVASDVTPDWKEGLSRITDYDVLADYALKIHKNSIFDSQLNITNSISSAVVYLYSCESNYRAMADYALQKCSNRTAAKKYSALADEAEKWQGYFLSVFPAAENDSYEYNAPDGSKIVLGIRLKTEYTAELLDMFSRVETFLEDAVPPEGTDNSVCREKYIEFLRSFKWLEDADFDYSQVDRADYEIMGWGSYYFHDADCDGTEELIIIAGTSMADSDCMVYSCVNGDIVFYGSVSCGYYSEPYGNAEKIGLVLTGAHGGLGYDTYLDVTSAGVREIHTDEYNYERADYVSTIPEGWNKLEGMYISDLFDGAADGGTDEGERGAEFLVDCLGGRITITLPGSWYEHFLIEEGEMGFSVYNKENHDANSGMGFLFSVTLSGHQSEEEFESVGYPDARIVGTWPGGLIVAMLPTDVQFDSNNDALTNIYMSMSADVDGVLDTVTLNE